MSGVRILPLQPMANPPTCVDVHLEDGTLKHMTLPEFFTYCIEEKIVTPAGQDDAEFYLGQRSWKLPGVR